MLDQDFCEFLAYKLSQAFKHADNEEISSFWCDGILLSQADNSYSQKSINANRQITMKAFIGKDGQSAYELILKFGNKALSRYARNLDIRDCIPVPDNINWLNVDIVKKRMEIQLD